MEIKKATAKDAKRLLRLMNKWADKIGRERWAGTGQECDCKKHKGCYAHLDFDAVAHIAHVCVHSAEHAEATALHEQLHLELGMMARCVKEMAWSGETEEQRQCAHEWYSYYEDQFIDKMTDVLLGMDKELNRLKRQVKRLKNV